MVEKIELLRALPFDIIPASDGVLLSRGSVRFQISGPDAEFIAGAVADLLTASTDREVLLEEFSEPDRANVSTVLDQLVARGFVVVDDHMEGAIPDDESPEDIFYWHFRETKDGVLEGLSEWTVFLIGVNFMTTYLIERLQRLGVTNVALLDDPSLRNHRFFNMEGAAKIDLGAPIIPASDEEQWLDLVVNSEKVLLVAGSDYGGARAFRAWNELAVEKEMIFLPVTMRGFRAEIGPVVRPNTGACYECFRARENANLEYRELVRAGEAMEEEGQARLAGFVDPMMALVSGAAATQILKLLAGIALVEPSTVTYVSTMKPTMSVHNVLRVPRCRVCSPTQWRPEINLKREEFRAKLAREQQ